MASETTRTRVGFFGRDFGRRTSSKYGSPVADTDVLVPESQVAPLADPESLSDDELQLSATQIRKSLAALRRTQKEMVYRLEQTQKTVEDETAGLEALTVSQARLEEWRSQISSTFIALMQQRMNSNLSQVRADLESYRKSVSEWKMLDEGTLLSLRQAFHRGFTKIFIRATVLIGLLILLTHLKSLRSLAWLAWLYDPHFTGPVLVALGILLYYSGVLLRKYFAPKDRPIKKRSKWRRAVWYFLWTLVVAVLIYYTDWLDKHLAPFLRTHYWEFFNGIVTLACVGILVLLAKYYSGWSTFRRAVNEQIAELQGVLKGYVSTQQELDRLTTLYPQALGWIELIANAVYRPWKTDPNWGNPTEVAREFDTFPHSLRIAQAKEASDPSIVALENGIARKLLVQGWRRQAFEDLIAQIAVEMGSDTDTLNIEALDKDLPHQSNNSRALIARYLDYSAALANAQSDSQAENHQEENSGLTRVDLSDHYLVEVARDRLVNLIETTQAQVLSISQPRVEQIIADPLLELKEEAAGVKGFDLSQDWQEFLRGSLGVDSIETVALGPLTFNVSGRMSGAAENPKTFILAPKRLEKDLPRVENEDLVSKVFLGDEKPRAVELMVRIDISKPVQVSELQVLVDTAAEAGDAGPQEPAAPRSSTERPL